MLRVGQRLDLEGRAPVGQQRGPAWRHASCIGSYPSIPAKRERIE
jgi:hypothetical protein